MAEDLQLSVESKLLELTLNDLKEVAVKLGIVDLQEELSKIAVIRLIRTAIEKSLGQDERANVEFLEALMKLIVGDPPPLEESYLEETENEGNSDEDMERERGELEKGKALVEQVKKDTWVAVWDRPCSVGLQLVCFGQPSRACEKCS